MLGVLGRRQLIRVTKPPEAEGQILVYIARLHLHFLFSSTYTVGHLRKSKKKVRTAFGVNKKILHFPSVTVQI